MKWQHAQLLDPNFNFVLFNYLRKNTVEDEIDFLYLGQNDEYSFYDLNRQMVQKQVITANELEFLYISQNFLD